MIFTDYLNKRRKLIDTKLNEVFPKDEENGDRLIEAMRYSLFAKGKRLRPILCLAACEAVGGKIEDALFCACALEMIHTYSLIHDDLPAMDDDEFRRGIFTNHKVFGEGLAILAGDGLLTKAMELLSNRKYGENIKSSKILRIAYLIMLAAGHKGMVGGQSVDIEKENEATLELVESLHQKKTASLIVAALQTGAIIGNSSEKDEMRLKYYGQKIGLAFQIVDDLLDMVGDFDKLGKSVRKDKLKKKLTYPSVVGFETAKETGKKLIDEAEKSILYLGAKAEPLLKIAHYIINRVT